jgi:hypothetical protein
MNKLSGLADHLTANDARQMSLEEKLLALFERVAGLLEGADRRQHQAQDWATMSGLVGLSPVQLALLGRPVMPQMLLQFLRDKEQGGSGGVSLRKVELRTRGLGDVLAAGVRTRSVSLSPPERRAFEAVTRDLGNQKLATLPLGASLQFEFTTSRPGYVTFVNIGTSGNVFLQVPNQFVPPRGARVEAGRAYRVPGPELLPLEEIGGYHENGPAGWEHLAVIVSDQPLGLGAVAERPLTSGLFPALKPAELASLSHELTALPPSAWSAGVLSFLVA